MKSLLNSTANIYRSFGIDHLLSIHSYAKLLTMKCPSGVLSRLLSFLITFVTTNPIIITPVTEPKTIPVTAPPDSPFAFDDLDLFSPIVGVLGFMGSGDGLVGAVGGLGTVGG